MFRSWRDWVLGAMVLTLAGGCSGGADAPVGASAPTEVVTTRLSDEERCGTAYEAPLRAGQTLPVGSVWAENDGDTLVVTYVLDAPWVMTSSALHVATSFDALPKNKPGNPQPGQFARKATHGTGVSEYEVTYDVATFGVSAETPRVLLFLAAHAEVRNTLTGATQGAWAGDQPFLGNNWATWFNYETWPCLPPPPPEIRPGDFRTHDHGGWGTGANGNNPGAYRDAHFAASFPDGLTVGSTYTVTFSTSQDVQNLLPTNGQPSALTASFLNPLPGVKPDRGPTPPDPGGTLLGHVASLVLNVEFDLDDPDFGAREENLRDLVVTEGPFEGQTVAQVLATAQQVLGGQATAWTVEQVNDCVQAINQNFEDGAVGTFLRLP